MLGYCFKIGIILLKSECDGYGVAFVEFREVDDAFVLLAEDDIAEGDDFRSAGS